MVMVGPGRASLQVWPQLHIGTVIKHTVKKRVTEVTRQMSHVMLEQAQVLLSTSRGGKVLNTVYFERLNETVRERLAALARQCHHPDRRLHAVIFPALTFVLIPTHTMPASPSFCKLQTSDRKIQGDKCINYAICNFIRHFYEGI